MTDPRRPVSRPHVLLGVFAAGVVLAAIVLTADLLRPPALDAVTGPPELGEFDSDPRDPISCETALPREGQERTGEPTGDGAATADPTEEVVGLSAPLVSSGQLYDCPEVYDGVEVRYVGEVIGAVLERDDGAWVQLNDDAYADEEGPGPLPLHRDYRGLNSGVGVFVPLDVADRIEWIGGPDAHGDVLRVSGVFQRVDPLTAEVAIIRADVGSIERRGGPLEEPLFPGRRTLALIVAAVALAVTLAERVRARRR